MIAAWIFLYLCAGGAVYDFWRRHIAHKYNTLEKNLEMLPKIVLLWPLVLFYYRDYL